MPNTFTFDTNELLAEVGWVRSLARELTGDTDSAEDLVQDTLVVALSGGPARPIPLRSWLGGVLRNLSRATARRDRHRGDREAAQVRDETSPATVDVVARASTQRSLVGLLLDLEEPYRTTLLLRFFDELSHAEIARQTGVPTSTVSTRMARGLERMRERLRKRYGDDEAWMAALLPLVRWKDGPRAALPGPHSFALGTPAKALLLVTAVLLTVASVYLTSTLRSTQREQPAPVARAGDPAHNAHESPRSRLETPPQRSPRGDVAVGPAAPLEPSSKAGSVHGRVIDLAGNGVGGIEVVAGPLPRATAPSGPAAIERTLAVSSSDGTFETSGNMEGCIVSVRNRGYTAVLASYLAGDAHELLVIVGRPLPLAGVVVDATGRGLAGAELAIVGRLEVISRLGLILDHGLEIGMEQVADASGYFEFDRAAAIPGGFLSARAPGYRPRFVPLPEAGDEQLTVVLEALEGGSEVIAGQVLEPAGIPAADALVSVGAVAVRTGSDGRFVLDRRHPAYERLPRNAPLTLYAVKPGFAAASSSLPALSHLDARAQNEPILLMLSPLEQAPVLAGRVLDAEGNPLRGAQVHLCDTTPFGEVPADAAGYTYYESSVEELVGGHARRAVTDREGRFRFEGLLERTYRLEAIDPVNLSSCRSSALAAGSRHVTLRLEDAAVRRIAGHVVDPQGAGRPGIHVSQVRPLPDGGLAFGARTTTDETGAFSLEGNVAGGLFLCLRGADIVPELQREISLAADVEALRVVVGSRCHVQFDWGRFDWARHARADTELRVLDGSGAPLPLVALRANSTRSWPSLVPQRRLSEVIVVPEEARFAVVLAAGKEVARIPMQLTPGDVTRVEL